MLSQLANFFITPVFAQADDYGLSATAGAADLAKYGTSLPGLIGNVLGTALSLVGVLFFALMLFGGVTWMLAHGNAEQEKKALNTIVAAIIGILIVLGSYALTTFVFKSVGSASSPTPPPPPIEEPVVGCKVLKDLTEQSWIDVCSLESHEPDDGECVALKICKFNN